MELEHVFDYEVRLKRPVVFGAGPAGTRVFFEVAEGAAHGPRLNGTVLSGGGDWMVVGADGWTRLDVRGQLRTDDGAVVYTTYRGVCEPTGAVAAAMAGRGPETGFGDQYWRVTPVFETGDARHAWLNQSVFVARGRAIEGPGVAYEVYRV
jgi:Protein of unknown function (DUF3237)